MRFCPACAAAGSSGRIGPATCGRHVQGQASGPSGLLIGQLPAGFSRAAPRRRPQGPVPRPWRWSSESPESRSLLTLPCSPGLGSLPLSQLLQDRDVAALGLGPWSSDAGPTGAQRCRLMGRAMRSGVHIPLWGAAVVASAWEGDAIVSGTHPALARKQSGKGMALGSAPSQVTGALLGGQCAGAKAFQPCLFAQGRSQVPLSPPPAACPGLCESWLGDR